MYDETIGDLLKRTENLKAFVLDVSKITDAPWNQLCIRGNNLSVQLLFTDDKFIKQSLLSVTEIMCFEQKQVL